MPRYDASKIARKLAKDVRAFLATHPVDTNPSDADIGFFNDLYIAANDFQAALIERIYSDESDRKTMSEAELEFTKGAKLVLTQILQSLTPIIGEKKLSKLEQEEKARKTPFQSYLQELENLVIDYFAHQE